MKYVMAIFALLLTFAVYEVAVYETGFVFEGIQIEEVEAVELKCRALLPECM